MEKGTGEGLTGYCFICAESEVQLRVRKFEILGDLFEEEICRECLEIEGDEWGEPWDRPEEGAEKA